MVLFKLCEENNLGPFTPKKIEHGQSGSGKYGAMLHRLSQIETKMDKLSEEIAEIKKIMGIATDS